MKDYSSPNLLGTQGIGYVKVPSLLGSIFVCMTRKGICRILLRKQDFLRFVREAEEERGMWVIPTPGLPHGVEVAFKRYFQGNALPPGLPLDFLEGTVFMRKVWRALQTIPHGQTRSYGWVAERVGRPKASRAIGGTCGANPIPIVVPCHRVVRSTGELGGFTAGISEKRRLLRLEGVIM